MRLKNKLQTPAPAGRKPKARFSPAKAAYYVFLSFMMFLMATQPVYASDVWTKATEIMKDVYNQIVLISTVAAIVTASVALLMMNFSRSGRTVDESRAWLKGHLSGQIPAVGKSIGESAIFLSGIARRQSPVLKRVFFHAHFHVHIFKCTVHI